MKILQTEAVSGSKLKTATSKLRSNLYSTSTVTGNTVAENLEAAEYYTAELAKANTLHPELISSYESLRMTSIRRSRNQAKMLIAQCEELIEGAKIALEVVAEIEGDSPVNESVMTESILPDIPTRVLSWLKEVAEVTKKVSAREVTTIRYTADNNKKLRKWHQKWNAAMKADDQSELDHVGELVKKLVR